MGRKRIPAGAKLNTGAARPVVQASPWPMVVVCLGVALATAGLYTLTAARDIVVGDTAELIAAALTLGVAHAPGYPLLTMVGHAFSWLPVGPDPFRVTLVAVLSGAITVGLTAVIIHRLTASLMAATLGAALLAVNPLFWSWSIVFEAFPFANVLVGALLLCLVMWQEQPDRTGWLVGGAFVAGLALSNHMTVVLLGPAILFLLWRHRLVLWRRPVTIAQCAVALMVGLLPYVYIPWAASYDPMINTGSVRSVSAFIELVTRADYGTGQLVAETANAGGSAASRIGALIASFMSVELLLIVAGLVSAFRTTRDYFWFVALAFGLAGPGFVAYANLDLGQPYGLFVLERFFLLSHVLLAPVAGLGLAWGEVRVGRLGSGRVAQTTLGLVVGSAVALTAATHFGRVDQRTNHVARHYAEDVLSSLEPRSILFISGDHTAFTVAYLQAVEHVRPDVTVILLPALRGPRWYTEQLQTRHPDLVLPFDRYDPRLPASSIKALVDANPNRPVAAVGRMEDQSLVGAYFGFTRGLVTQIERLDQPRYLPEMVRENERLMLSYRIPSPDAIKMGTFEMAILREYAAPAMILGNEFARAGRPEEAQKYWERALAIDPSFTEARDALAGLTSR